MGERVGWRGVVREGMRLLWWEKRKRGTIKMRRGDGGDKQTGWWWKSEVFIVPNNFDVVEMHEYCVPPISSTSLSQPIINPFPFHLRSIRLFRPTPTPTFPYLLANSSSCSTLDYTPLASILGPNARPESLRQHFKANTWNRNKLFTLWNELIGLVNFNCAEYWIQCKL